MTTGLEDPILPYVPFFRNNNINGCRLLLLSCDDLENLNVTKIGHQEIILDAVDLLKQLHYNFCTETLQTLALKLGCKARSLISQLKAESAQRESSEEKTKARERVSTITLSVVCEIMSSVKSFISWIDRYPFDGQDDYILIRKNILKISIELASTAQRDQFVEHPNEVIQKNCVTLVDICDRIVQDLSDSLAIQPAWLDVVPIKKKKDEELGLHIHSSYSGIHIIGGIKYQSAADVCTRIEEGDEIVQINYQTVVGWQLKKLVNAMKEYSTELVLTLKKRPRHSPTPGQLILLKPYKIPSIKLKRQGKYQRSPSSSSMSDHSDNQAIIKSSINKEPTNNNNVENEIQLAKDAKPCQIKGSVYLLMPRRPRITVRRRATISGASPPFGPSPSPSPSPRLNAHVGRKDFVARSISQDDAKSGEYGLSNKFKTINSAGHTQSYPKVSSLSPSSQGSNNACNTTENTSLSTTSLTTTRQTSSSYTPKYNTFIAIKPRQNQPSCERLNENLQKSASPKSSIGSQTDLQCEKEKVLTNAKSNRVYEYLVANDRQSDNGASSCELKDTSTSSYSSESPQSCSISSTGSEEPQEVKKEKPIAPKKSRRGDRFIVHKDVPRDKENILNNAKSNAVYEYYLAGERQSANVTRSCELKNNSANSLSSGSPPSCSISSVGSEEYQEIKPDKPIVPRKSKRADRLILLQTDVPKEKEKVLNNVKSNAVYQYFVAGERPLDNLTRSCQIKSCVLKDTSTKSLSSESTPSCSVSSIGSEEFQETKKDKPVVPKKSMKVQQLIGTYIKAQEMSQLKISDS